MRSVAFYSYKGGVGRSLALANVACGLALGGQRVVLLDLDLEAPGLHHKLEVHWRDVNGLVDLAGDFYTDGRLPDVTASLLEVDSPGPGTVRLLPAASRPGPARYWSRLAQIDWRALLYQRDGLSFFLSVQQQISDAGYDALLIDSRTGVSELGGLATHLLADTVVALTTNTDESREGLRAVLRSVQAHPAPLADAVRLIPVLARAPADQFKASEAVDRLRAYLREPAPTLAATLPDVAPLRLTQDAGLQDQESVFLAAESNKATPLLVDYVVLLKDIFPDVDLRGVADAMARLDNLRLDQLVQLSELFAATGVWTERLSRETATAGLTWSSAVTAVSALRVGVPREEVVGALASAGDGPARRRAPGEATELHLNPDPERASEQARDVLDLAESLVPQDPVLAARVAALCYRYVPGQVASLLGTLARGVTPDALPAIAELLREAGMTSELVALAGPPDGWAEQDAILRDTLRSDLSASAVRHRDTNWAAALLDEPGAPSRDLLGRLRLAAIAERQEQAALTLAAVLGAVTDPAARLGIYREALELLPHKTVRAVVRDVLGEREAARIT